MPLCIYCTYLINFTYTKSLLNESTVIEKPMFTIVDNLLSLINYDDNVASTDQPIIQ